MNGNGILMPINSWNQALTTSSTTLLANVMNLLPKIVGAIVVVVVGWFLAFVAKRVLKAILNAVQFNTISERVGLTKFLHDAGFRKSPMEVVGEIIRWFVFVCFLLAGLAILGLPAVSGMLSTIIGYIPKVVAAVLILTGGLLIANILADLIRGTLKVMGLRAADVMASIAKWILIVFTVLAVIRQLDIVPDLINILFIGIVGALALAVGLMFGLGGRDVANQIMQQWYEQGRRMEFPKSQPTEQIRRNRR